MFDETETDEFADKVIDIFCPDTAAEVTTEGGLLFGMKRHRKVLLSPAARRAIARADRLEDENLRLRDELAKKKQTSDCGITIDAFSKRCGVSVRTVKYWNVNGGPTVFDTLIKKDVTYSKELLRNSEAALRFATAYKLRRTFKRGHA